MTAEEPAAAGFRKSLIVPVYKNAANIPALIGALNAIAAREGKDFEVVFVVDGSPDDSRALLAAALPSAGFSSRLVNLSENTGAFSAIRTGLRYAEGGRVAVMSADLQEPSELIHRFFEALEEDAADIIFGRRMERAEAAAGDFLARLFWAFYRRLAVRAMPPGGADVFAFNGKVKEAVLAQDGPGGLLVPQLFSLGRRRLFIPYKREKRESGKSAWSTKKKIVYAVSAVCHYADYWVIFLLCLGAFGAAAAVFYAAAAPLPAGLLFQFSAALAALGTLGCFLRRRIDGAGKRGLSVVHSVENFMKERA